jgi:hypothetical protein
MQPNMKTFLIILLAASIVTLIMGIVRVAFNYRRYDNPVDLIFDMLFLDVMIDTITSLFD